MDRVDYESLVIQDILNYYERDELNINPWYQRRAVWKRPQKSYLINTIHEGKPVPSVYISWTQSSEIRSNLEHTLDPSDPFFGVVLRYANFLSDIRFARNQIVHANAGTRSTS